MASKRNPKQNQWWREYRERKGQKWDHDRALRRRYGITLADYDDILLAQNGVCAICQQSQRSGRRLDVDHEHETGTVRGLLCNRCNRGLGLFQDSPALLRAAAEYLDDED